MNRIERLTAIIILLQEGRRTSSELARRFEVSKRTLLRDIQALCEMGVPVVAEWGPGGGYSLLPEYTLAPLPLTFRLAIARQAVAPSNCFCPRGSTPMAAIILRGVFLPAPGGAGLPGGSF